MTARLTDGVVALRYYRPGDVAAVFEAVDESRTEIGAWMDWCHADYGLDDTETWVASQPELRALGDHPMVIVDAGTDRVLGSSGLNQVNTIHGFANLGYWVRTSAAGNGVASRAARLVAIAGLSALGLRRIEIVTDVSNAPSIRVAEKIGAHCEGIARQRLRHGGEHHDAYMFSLVTEDLDRLIEEATAGGTGEPRIELASS